MKNSKALKHVADMLGSTVVGEEMAENLHGDAEGFYKSREEFRKWSDDYIRHSYGHPRILGWFERI